MSKISQRERAAQNRIVKFSQQELGTVVCVIRNSGGRTPKSHSIKPNRPLVLVGLMYSLQRGVTV